MDVKEQKEALIAALETPALAQGLCLVDVEIAGTPKAPVVRVFLEDKDKAITLDELAHQNEWVEQILDELDLISSSYTLEVSSPGMARPLRTSADFEQYAGQEVALTTYAKEGRRKYTGTLEGIEGTQVTLICDGKPVSFAVDEIQTCKLKPDFDAILKKGTKK